MTLLIDGKPLGPFSAETLPPPRCAETCAGICAGWLSPRSRATLTALVALPYLSGQGIENVRKGTRFPWRRELLTLKACPTIRMFGEGYGEKVIAKQLNKGHTGRLWRPSTIYFMLQNSRYAGKFYFNRREWRKNPETGRRVYRWRPKDQWESRFIEGLRIVDDATWEAAQHRLRTRKHLFSTGTSGIPLLSGILVCDGCGGPFTLISNCYGCKNRAESFSAWEN